MNYYREIKQELINNEITKRVKDYSKNRSDLNIYYNVGKLLSEAGKHYGKGIIKEYSEKLMSNEEPKVNDLIKNPILIKNSYDYKEISEKILQKLILEDLNNFVKELGVGFCYIESEYKIKIGDRYNYIDLLLYNIKYNAYVVVELKVTELKKEHMGQIETYMN